MRLEPLCVATASCDMDIAVPANDERAVEVLAAGLPLHHGAQLGSGHYIAKRFDRERHSAPQCGSGIWRNLQEGPSRQGTEAYLELLAGDRCRLVVVATGGRWSEEAMQFVDDLAAARARDAPPLLRRSAFLAWSKRWSRMIAISCARAFANSLVAISTSLHALAGVDGRTDLVDLLGEG